MQRGDSIFFGAAISGPSRDGGCFDLLGAGAPTALRSMGCCRVEKCQSLRSATSARCSRGAARLRGAAGGSRGENSKMQEVLTYKYGNIGQVYQLLGSNNKLCGLRSKKKFSVP